MYSLYYVNCIVKDHALTMRPHAPKADSVAHLFWRYSTSVTTACLYWQILRLISTLTTDGHCDVIHSAQHWMLVKTEVRCGIVLFSARILARSACFIFTEYSMRNTSKVQVAEIALDPFVFSLCRFAVVEGAISGCRNHLAAFRLACAVCY